MIQILLEMCREVKNWSSIPSPCIHNYLAASYQTTAFQKGNSYRSFNYVDCIWKYW